MGDDDARHRREQAKHARPDLGIARPGLERVGGVAPDPAVGERLVVGGGQRLPGRRLHAQHLRLHLEQDRGHARGRRLPLGRGIGGARHLLPGGREVAVHGVFGRRYLPGEQAIAQVVVRGDLRGKAALGGRPVVGAAVGIQVIAAAGGRAVGERGAAEHQRRVSRLLARGLAEMWRCPRAAPAARTPCGRRGRGRVRCGGASRPASEPRRGRRRPGRRRGDQRDRHRGGGDPEAGRAADGQHPPAGTAVPGRRLATVGEHVVHEDLPVQLVSSGRQAAIRRSGEPGLQIRVLGVHRRASLPDLPDISDRLDRPAIAGLLISWSGVVVGSREFSRGPRCGRRSSPSVSRASLARARESLERIVPTGTCRASAASA